MSRATPSGRAVAAAPSSRSPSRPCRASIPVAWIVAAAEAGRNDPDPFYQPKGNEQ